VSFESEQNNRPSVNYIACVINAHTQHNTKTDRLFPPFMVTHCQLHF